MQFQGGKGRKNSFLRLMHTLDMWWMRFQEVYAPRFFATKLAYVHCPWNAAQFGLELTVYVYREPPVKLLAA